MCVLLKVQGDGIAKEIDKTSDLKREKHRICGKIWQLKLRQQVSVRRKNRADLETNHSNRETAVIGDQ